MDEAGWPLAVGAVDWSRPWFAPWRATGERVARRLGAGLALHDALNAEPGSPVRFIEQDALPAGQAYEHTIFSSRSCPVRPGLHDFFNGLAWLQLPLTKSRLNQLQAAELSARGVGGRRGPVRDAITVFDENGAILDAPPALWNALLERDWQRLFVDLRPAWNDARLLVVGHALLEKLMSPRKALTAHVWRLPVALDLPASADAQLAGQLTGEFLASKPFTPLPLLGVPGWYAGNQDDCFYDDAQVFRLRSTSVTAAATAGTDPVHP
ncbi:MAG: DUF3025 domain-containing protein [Ramlibacter sp.]